MKKGVVPKRGARGYVLDCCSHAAKAFGSRAERFDEEANLDHREETVRVEIRRTIWEEPRSSLHIDVRLKPC